MCQLNKIIIINDNSESEDEVNKSPNWKSYFFQAQRERDIIVQALRSFSQSTCIRFTPLNNQRDFVNIQSRAGYGHPIFAWINIFEKNKYTCNILL